MGVRTTMWPTRLQGQHYEKLRSWYQITGSRICWKCEYVTASVQEKVSVYVECVCACVCTH